MGKLNQRIQTCPPRQQTATIFERANAERLWAKNFTDIGKILP